LEAVVVRLGDNSDVFIRVAGDDAVGDFRASVVASITGDAAALANRGRVDGDGTVLDDRQATAVENAATLANRCVARDGGVSNGRGLVGQVRIAEDTATVVSRIPTDRAGADRRRAIDGVNPAAAAESGIPADSALVERQNSNGSGADAATAAVKSSGSRQASENRVTCSNEEDSWVVWRVDVVHGVSDVGGADGDVVVVGVSGDHHIGPGQAVDGERITNDKFCTS